MKGTEFTRILGPNPLKVSGEAFPVLARPDKPPRMTPIEDFGAI